ncbi:MmgE/PrpD family protein [Xylophilus sp. GOD-11R]|uniref:MmgE/PrpD family protein n=1 Tax=Xylophilus sp. GOD-11R TaxID=3089814 RepID=UPI00298D5FE3|nr:MmgE/PrpD family protein [Xylophilus sp. GOD-11R]WPB55505.1 MmgE/PrpD family protein [Xylophilus sp. GOD-11R]
MPPTLCERLAALAIDTPAGALPALAIERAQMVVASTLASAAAGYGIDSARVIRDLELADGGTPSASVWFSDRRLPLRAAARVNAVASDAAASDDSDLRSIAHIGTVITAVALAVAEAEGSGGQAVLQAMVLGYEVAGRIDESLTPNRMRRGFHGSVSTVFGGVVAGGRLFGLDRNRMAHALALAATSIGGLAMAADTSCAREYHAGLSASTAVNALLAARAGFEAELQVLDSPRGFLQAMGAQEVEAITADWGASWDITTDMAIKLMPGAHPFHATAEAAADAAALARAEGGLRLEDIAGIEISAAVQWTHFQGDPHPRNLVDAAHSIVYFVAAAIVDGGFGWQHMDETRMADPAIAALQDKIVMDPSPPALPDRFPHRHGGAVTLTLADGRRYRAECKAPRGSGPRGVLWSDVQDKFRHLMPASGLDETAIAECLDCVMQLPSAPRVDRLVDATRVAGAVSA